MKSLLKGMRVQKKKDFSSLVRDPDGEDLVKKIGKELKAAGKIYVDGTFTPGPAMLFSNPSNPAPFLENIDADLKANKIKWLRPNDIGDTKEQFQVFAQGIEPEDINQGAIGDCYFLAALAICATREELISDLIVEDCAEQGIYGVKFFYEGAWKTVIVDDLFPCHEVNGQWLPIFCRWKGEKETWAMIAEKAWAKLHGSYEAIDGGRTEDALGYLSGGCTITTFFQDREKKMVPDVVSGKLWEKLLRDHHSNSKEIGCFMSASGVKEKTGGKKGDENPSHVDKGSTGLVSGHAYSVLDIEAIQGHQLIQLRNPWGSFEWGGDWSDHSPLWTESLKKAVNFVAADDGSFWMSFGDFVKEYSQIGVCKTIPISWKTEFKRGGWRAPEFAGGNSETLGHFNPTFELKNESSTVWIQLEQRDQRKEKGDWIICDLRVIKKPKDDEATNIFALVAPLMTLVERQRTIELELDPAEGPYLILVTAWGPGIEGDFFLSVHSPGDVELKGLPTKKPTASEAAQMAPVVFPSHCAVCEKAVNPYDQKSIRGLRWHSTCHKCISCGNTDVYEIGKENGKWRPFCFECWLPKFADRCLECGKPVQVSKAGLDPVSSVLGKGKLHLTCREAYKFKELLKTASKCFFCKEPIVKIDGKFSGQYFEVDGQGDIHAECHPHWKKTTAPNCFFCKQGILEVPGKFSGRYFTIDGKGGLHEECRDKYNESQAKKCLQCSFALLTIEGQFTGRFLPVNDAGVHEECLTNWKISSAEKCFFCHQPVCAIQGKFSGSHYDIPGKGKLHEECGEAWRKTP